jgi:hypothetical protein
LKVQVAGAIAPSVPYRAVFLSGALDREIGSPA